LETYKEKSQEISKMLYESEKPEPIIFNDKEISQWGFRTHHIDEEVFI